MPRRRETPVKTYAEPFDAVAILQSIARNESASACARVAACKILLAHQSAPANEAPVLDAITRRAIEAMARDRDEERLN
jgi:hypothetical protein